jgi:predicted GNAT family acetyltransferase
MAVMDFVSEPTSKGDEERPPRKDGASQDGSSAALESALRKAGWRLIPLCVAIAISNHMDRSK